jgi:hypothetical protein
MSDSKISELSPKTTPIGADITNILDSAASNEDKRITLGDLPLTGNRELKALATGLLKNTTTTGTPSIATLDTDYAPGVAGVYTVGKSAGCSTFAAAVATIGATPATLVVPSTVAETISADLPIPSTLHVVIHKGAVITIGTVALAGASTITYADTADGGTLDTYSSTGTPTTGSPIITAVGSTAGICIGAHLETVVGFPAGQLLVIDKTATTITVNTNATSTPGAGQTLISLDCIKFSADQHTNIYTRHTGVGFIKADPGTGAERKRILKLMGDGTIGLMAQPFSAVVAAGTAWSYSHQILTVADTTGMVEGDVITVGTEVFLVTAIINGTSVYVDHHPISEYTAQATTRYRRLSFLGSVDIGPYQAFSGYGATFNGNSVYEVRPEWFGATGQYNPDNAPSIDHDDSVAIQAALYSAAWIADTTSNNSYKNLHNKHMLLSGHYKVTKSIFMVAETVGIGQRVAEIYTTITDGSPTLVYDFYGGASGLGYWSNNFRDYSVRGTSLKNNTIGHLFGFNNYSRYTRLFSNLVNYGMVSWENWSNIYDINVYNCNYGLIVSLGGASNQWYGSVEQCSIVGVDFGYGAKWGALSSGIINLLVEGNYTSVPFRIGVIKNSSVVMYCEMGGGTATNYVQGLESGAQIINTDFSVYGSGCRVVFDYMVGCNINKCNVPYTYNTSTLSSDNTFPKLAINTNGFSNPHIYPFIGNMQPPINYFVNPFFTNAIRGYKYITQSNATFAVDILGPRMGNGGLKVNCTNGTNTNYVDIELPLDVVMAIRPQNDHYSTQSYTISYWYFFAAANTATMTPWVAVMESRDGGVTYANRNTIPTTFYTSLGNWQWQATGVNISNTMQLHVDTTNIVLRFYGNASANNAGANNYVTFSGVYFGATPSNFTDLQKCLWIDSGIGGRQVGTNLVFPIAKYSLSSQTIAIEKDAKTLTRVGGSFITDGIRVGDTIALGGCTTGSNNGNYLISNITATVLTYTTTTGGTTTEAGSGAQTVNYNINNDVLQTYLQGDEWRNSLPVASGVPGGVCVTAGAGGTAVFNNRAALVP